MFSGNLDLWRWEEPRCWERIIATLNFTCHDQGFFKQAFLHVFFKLKCSRASSTSRDRFSAIMQLAVVMTVCGNDSVPWPLMQCSLFNTSKVRTPLVEIWLWAIPPVMNYEVMEPFFGAQLVRSKCVFHHGSRSRTLPSCWLCTAWAWTIRFGVCYKKPLVLLMFYVGCGDFGVLLCRTWSPEQLRCATQPLFLLLGL